LRDDTQAIQTVRLINRSTKQVNSTAIDFDPMADGANERRFASPIRSKQSHAFSSRNLQRNTVERLDGPEFSTNLIQPNCELDLPIVEAIWFV
jgi:hypothetical protein